MNKSLGKIIIFINSIKIALNGMTYLKLLSIRVHTLY